MVAGDVELGADVAVKGLEEARKVVGAVLGEALELAGIEQVEEARQQAIAAVDDPAPAIDKDERAAKEREDIAVTALECSVAQAGASWRLGQRGRRDAADRRKHDRPMRLQARRFAFDNAGRGHGRDGGQGERGAGEGL